MRILVLSKRQYTGKDLLDDRYGRLYEIPRHLALNNHQVVGLCLSYRQKPEGLIQGPDIDGSPVAWHSVNLGLSGLPGVLRHQRLLARVTTEFDPQLLLACSDALHIIAGRQIAQKLHIPWVADLYDNFESFGLTRTPGITSLFRKAVGKADGVICVSNTLNHYTQATCHPHGVVKTVVNGTDREIFRPLDKHHCRKKLGLPEDAKIIGTAGALSNSRGIDTLFKGFAQLAKEDHRIHLALAGPVGRDVSIPTGPRSHYLGNLSHAEVPIFLNALDVAVICNIDSPFGRYCFPQKAYEILACRVPLVAAAVGAVAELLENHSEHLYTPDNSKSLIRSIQRQLNTPSTVDIAIRTWTELSTEVENILAEVLATNTMPQLFNQHHE